MMMGRGGAKGKGVHGKGVEGWRMVIINMGWGGVDVEKGITTGGRK